MSCKENSELVQSYIIDDNGAIVRMDTTKKNIYLVFTGHEFADGYEIIRETLSKYQIKGALLTKRHVFFESWSRLRKSKKEGRSKNIF